VISNGYERQFVYVYGAVSLQQVSQAHPTDLIVMVLDGASSHKARELNIPANIRLLALPPYAPELNPQEHVWDELREKEIDPAISN